MFSVKKLVVLTLACAALPAFVAFAQSKSSKSRNPPSPLAGQPFRPKLDAPAAADWRTIDPQDLLVIDTTKGRILVEMIPEIAPKTVERIKTLASQHFYDGLTFHRVIDGFMAQGGDPAGDGTGGSTLPNIPAEFTFRHGTNAPYVKIPAADGMESGFVRSEPVSGQSSDLAPLTNDGKVNAYGRFCTGTAGFARSGDPDSGNSQFYLMRAPRDSLETMYTVWGRVVVGEDVVKALKTGEPVVNPDKMTTVRVASDLPQGERPKVQVVDAGSAWMKTAAKYVQDICDIDLPAKVN
jgi:peptidylprolyl isomerase